MACLVSLEVNLMYVFISYLNQLKKDTEKNRFFKVKSESDWKSQQPNIFLVTVNTVENMAIQTDRISAFSFHYQANKNQVQFHTQSMQGSQFEEKFSKKKKVLNTSANSRSITKT